MPGKRLALGRRNWRHKTLRRRITKNSKTVKKLAHVLTGMSPEIGASGKAETASVRLLSLRCPRPILPFGTPTGSEHCGPPLRSFSTSSSSLATIWGLGSSDQFTESVIRSRAIHRKRDSILAALTRLVDVLRKAALRVLRHVRTPSTDFLSTIALRGEPSNCGKPFGQRLREFVLIPFRWPLIRWLGGNRLFQFFLIGGVIFALAPRAHSSRQIRISQSSLVALQRAEARRLGLSQLSEAQSAAVADRAFEDEVLFREGLRLGFDRNDNIVRQRLIEKTLFLAEDLGGSSRPVTEEELRGHFESHPERWSTRDEISLLHVYFSAKNVGQAHRIREQLLSSPELPDAPPPVGDAFPLRRQLTANVDELSRTYGSTFAQSVVQVPLGVWSEPIRSKFGWHLVLVTAHSGKHAATFAEVREQVRLDYLRERKQRAIGEYLRQASKRYEITLDGRLHAPQFLTSERIEPSQVDD